MNRPISKKPVRAILLVAALLFTAALLSACGSGEDSRQGEPLALSCANIGALGSYRYSINVRLKIPVGSPTGTSSPQPPLSAFSEDLYALLSDFTIDGAYVAPDHTTAILRFQKDEVELRAIAGKTWERLGGRWQEQQDTATHLTLLTPDVVCNDTVRGLAPSFAGVKAQDDTTNGIATRHYHLDRADIVLPAGARSVVPESYQVDLWLAKDGLWPVRLDVETTATNERFLMEFRDVNDPGIRIEPPTKSSPGS